VGEDIKTAQGLFHWRKPLVDFLSDGIWEVRSTLPNTIARVLFAEVVGEMVLLHAFKKKTQKTPTEELNLAIKRKKIYENTQ
jgi:phage-related protein